MIISHRHRFIFLHCRKVAGSSITALLNRYLGPEDIQIGVWGDTLKTGGKLNRKAVMTLARNPLALAMVISGVPWAIVRGKDSVLGRAINPAIKLHYGKRFSCSPTHAIAADVKKFDPAAWQDYFKFCFVRNPYEHAVSDYFWKNCPAKGVSFEEFLERKLDPARHDPEMVAVNPRTNWEVFTIKNRVVVDAIGRFESLEADLLSILKKIGIEDDLDEFSCLKKASKNSKEKILYNRKCFGLVSEIYSNEINMFNYKIPEYLINDKKHIYF